MVVLIGFGAARIAGASAEADASQGKRAESSATTAGVAPVTTAASEAVPADPVAALPSCIPVADFSGDTVGCALKAQLYPANESVTTREPPKGMPGFPVYGREGGALVGYEVTGLGYVPVSMAADGAALSKLRDCMTKLNSGALDGSELDGCVAPLRQFGIADPVAEARERAASLEQVAPTLP
jgi:hypothetical protein